MSRITIKDNSTSKESLSKQQLESLTKYAGISLQELCKKNTQLLIFPHSLGENQDDIGKQKLFDIVESKLKTGNVLGFFGIDDTQVTIHSRFDDESEKQYFLHYMLQKVFGINILQLKTHMGKDELWEFLIFLFPYCLVRALKQGIIRAYHEHQENDNKVKGTIDIARHLKLNIPFTGKIAYRVRQYSADNPIMQLIRHTIEFINRDNRRSFILRNNIDIKEGVSKIIELTPSYNAQNRSKVIFQNLRSINHPYFTEYNFLRNLCLKILRHDRVSIYQDKKHIWGIVFDGAWLWEEYLAIILKKLNFEHPKNKTGKGRYYLFTDNKTGHIYPDFIGENFILDAKYKPLDKKIPRNDRFQIISYMHVLGKSAGFLLYPSNEKKSEIKNKNLNGYGGEIGSIAFEVPNSQTSSWDDFSNAMQKSEDSFYNKVLECTRINKNAICNFANKWIKNCNNSKNNFIKSEFGPECLQTIFSPDMLTYIQKEMIDKNKISEIKDITILCFLIFAKWRYYSLCDDAQFDYTWFENALRHLAKLTK